MTSCPGRPDLLLGQPIGMYHCEFCGAMVLAGVPHPSDEDVREQGIPAYGDESELDRHQEG
jgi:hypothetical protein